MRVGFFVTCLVDLMRPTVGFAAIEAARSWRRRGLRAADGRPAAASRRTTPAIAPTPRTLAAKVIAEFEGCDYVVAPSGSCAGMIRTHYARPASTTIPRCSRRARRRWPRAPTN